MRSNLLFAFLLALAGCGDSKPAGPIHSSPSVRTIAPGPISYFQDRCARCHGPYGAFYSEALKSRPHDSMIAKVDEMCRGPGGMALDAEGVAAQAAFHEARARGAPFISISSSDTELTGEVTPDSTVRIVWSGGASDAAVDGHFWRAPMPAASGWTIEAKLNDFTVTLDPLQRAWNIPPK